MRFLIDECLSTTLARVAADAGYEARHVVHAGMAGWGDWTITRYAVDGDFVLVTNNARDYRALYGKEAFHAGLVILLPNVNLGGQRRMSRAALDALAGLGEPVNHVLEVDTRDGRITFDFYELPNGGVGGTGEGL